MNPANNENTDETLVYTQLVRVASELSQVCLIHGKSEEEAVKSFTKAFDLLQDWYLAVPLKEEVKSILDKLVPTDDD